MFPAACVTASLRVELRSDLSFVVCSSCYGCVFARRETSALLRLKSDRQRRERADQPSRRRSAAAADPMRRCRCVLCSELTCAGWRGGAVADPRRERRRQSRWGCGLVRIVAWRRQLRSMTAPVSRFDGRSAGTRGMWTRDCANRL